MTVTRTKLEVLDPTAEPTASQGTLSPRLDTLAGKTIGVIWNGRLPGDQIISHMFSILKAEYDLKEVVFRGKPYLGNIAPEAMFDELSATCDAVITGVGD